MNKGNGKLSQNIQMLWTITSGSSRNISEDRLLFLDCAVFIEEERSLNIEIKHPGISRVMTTM